jgi:hypothetical protein
LREGIIEQGRTAPEVRGINPEEEAKMVRIEQGMGEEIIRHMDTILYLPGKILLCARHDNSPGAIMAFYVDNCGKKIISWYWFKLREEIKNQREDTAHIVVAHESKLSLDEFLKFLTDERTPVFKIAAQFEQAIENNMTPGTALDFIKAGVNLERIGLGLSPIDFSDSLG